MSKDWGARVSKSGEDVKTADKENLEISSKYPMFKIKAQGSKSLRMYKTTTNEILDGAEISIDLTDASNFPTSHTSGQVAYVAIDDTDGGGNWELVSYTGKSGNTLTGCTRGYLSSTAGGHANGVDVVQVYSETNYNHDLGYPPVHFVYQDDDGDSNMIVPKKSLTVENFYLDAWITSSRLFIAAYVSDITLGTPPIPSGSYDTYNFKYTVMLDSILTPYY